MRAIVVRKYGPPENMELREMPDPQPQPGEVLIRVRAIGINFADILGRMGFYQGVPKPPYIPGLELAGEVEADASGRLRPGQRVAALSMFHAYAERIAVRADQVFPVPDDVPLEDAAAIPVNYLTAWHSMFYMGNLQEGDRILIHGAAGGVGIAAVQLAKARKLITFGTAGASKQDYLRSIGVDHPIDYTRDDFQKAVRKIAPEGIEMVLDAVGGDYFRRSYRCLGPTGRLVVYGFSTIVGPSGKREPVRAAKAMWQTPRFHPLKLIEHNVAVIGVHIGRMGHRGQVLKPQLEEIYRLYGTGEVKPVISKSFPLAEAAEAHRYIHARKNIGKVLLIP